MWQRADYRFLLFLGTLLTAAFQCPSIRAEGQLSPPISIDFSFDPARNRQELRVKGLDPAALAKLEREKNSRERWSALYGVYTLPDDGVVPPDQPPLSGSYGIEGDTLVFTPRHLLTTQDVSRLRNVLDPALLKDRGRIPRNLLNPRYSGRIVIDQEISSRLRGPSRNQTPARISGVYPSAPILPENLLKFYIYFSVPMSRGEASRRIHLLDSDEKAVVDPFLELDEELWSADGMRFTLLFDPGRIKRGLKPREELGPVLEQGKSYTLVIDRGWPDAQGGPLESELRQSFKVGPPDETPLDHHLWTIRAPNGGTRFPLEIRFSESIDHALALRLITVRDARGTPVRGEVAMSSAETVWSLTPLAPWKPGGYQVIIGTELEDLAGNNIGRPFEVDLVGPISRRVQAETVSLPFRIGPERE